MKDFSDPISQFFRLAPIQAKALERLGLAAARDLLYYFPTRHEGALAHKKISDVAKGDEVVVIGEVKSAKTSKGWRSKIAMGEMVVSDLTGSLKAVWFHQPYLAKKVPPGQLARLAGKVMERRPARTERDSARSGGGELYLANPEVEPAQDFDEVDSLFSSEGGAPAPLRPVYPETRGLSSGWFHWAAKRLLAEGLHEQIPEPLPEPILKRYNLPGLATALVWIHTPRQSKDAEAARKRFAFEEIFLIQLARHQAKLAYQAEPSFTIALADTEINNFIARFPFPPTGAQRKAIEHIRADLQAGKPMLRLLEGDVGSGKTFVAAVTAYAAVRAGFEVAYMAPTEILARQHFASFIEYFRGLNTQVGLITGAECRKFPSKITPTGDTHISRPQLLKWVHNGEIPIVVGTHALIQKEVRFKNLAYVIIDEQHRFGVNQRAKLAQKPARTERGSARSGGEGRAPHLLSMTATPIPRTLALTIFGDLDLTLLDEQPAGRKPIVTEVVTETKRAQAYEHIRRELQAGRQAYVICPRIDEPDPTKELALQAKSAKAEAKLLQEKIFPNYSVGLVHSKLKSKDKEEVMREFAASTIDILVATSVVEVGVNVPNATIIIIEGAERFGLAQLHQLRGRVLRSSHQAYCYLFTKTATIPPRLEALKKAANGFALAELDLELRGAGALTGGKQWGISDVGMEALKNIKMVEAARQEAQAVLAADPTLVHHPLLRARLPAPTDVHFE